MKSHTRGVGDPTEVCGRRRWKTAAMADFNYGPADRNDKETESRSEPKKRLLTERYFSEGGPANVKQAAAVLVFSRL